MIGKYWQKLLFALPRRQISSLLFISFVRVYAMAFVHPHNENLIALYVTHEHHNNDFFDHFDWWTIGKINGPLMCGKCAHGVYN